MESRIGWMSSSLVIFSMVCVRAVAAVRCYDCSSHDDEGVLLDPACRSGDFPPRGGVQRTGDYCNFCSSTTNAENPGIVRGCEENNGGLKLGCNEIDFFGTVFTICICQTDYCNDDCIEKGFCNNEHSVGDFQNHVEGVHSGAKHVHVGSGVVGLLLLVWLLAMHGIQHML